jgi:hypothetical protein
VTGLNIRAVIYGTDFTVGEGHPSDFLRPLNMVLNSSSGSGILQSAEYLEMFG